MGDSDSESKTLAKMKANPTVPIGIVGLVGVVAYSFLNLRKRKEKLSVYLIHTRIAAQGTLMLCITLGLVYTLGTKHWNKLFPEKKN